MAEGKDSTTITIRISKQLKKELYKAMVRDRRSMTNFLICAIEDRIKQIGILPE